MKKRLLSLFLAIVMLCSVQVIASATGTWYDITQDVGSGYSVTNSTGSYLIGTNTIYKFSYTSASDSWQSITYNSNFTGKRVCGGDDDGFYYLSGTSIYKATYSTSTSTWTDTLYTTLSGPYTSSAYFSNAIMYYSSVHGLFICFGNYTLKYQSGTLTVYTGSTTLVTDNTASKLMRIKRGTNTGMYLRNDTGIYYFTNNAWAYKASVNYTPVYEATNNSTACDGCCIYLVGGKDVIPGQTVIYQTSIYRFNPATGTISLFSSASLPEGRYNPVCFFSSGKLAVAGGDTNSTKYGVMNAYSWVF